MTRLYIRMVTHNAPVFPNHIMTADSPVSMFHLKFKNADLLVLFFHSCDSPISCFKIIYHIKVSILEVRRFLHNFQILNMQHKSYCRLMKLAVGVSKIYTLQQLLTLVKCFEMFSLVKTVISTPFATPLHSWPVMTLHCIRQTPSDKQVANLLFYIEV